MQAGTRIKLTEKVNARSTDPITGEATGTRPFTVIKRGTTGTVAVSGATFSVVLFDGHPTRQELHNDLLKAL